MTRTFRANFSDPAFPQVDECDPSSEGATTFREAKFQVMQTIASHLNHWKVQMEMLRRQNACNVLPLGRPLTETIGQPS